MPVITAVFTELYKKALDLPLFSIPSHFIVLTDISLLLFSHPSTPNPFLAYTAPRARFEKIPFFSGKEKQI